MQKFSKKNFLINFRDLKMRTYILILASIFCVAQASFRSTEEHGASFEAAKTHPARGAALIVISEVTDGDFSVSNGVYIAPGIAITHAHTGRTKKYWVISPFAGGSTLVYDLTLEGNSTDVIIKAFSLNIESTLAKYPNACREVSEIRFPGARKLVDKAEALSAKLLLGTNAGNQSCSEYVAAAAVSPLALTGDDQYSIGPDYCTLSFTAFQDGHPIAEILNEPLPAEAVVTVLGTSLHTHVYDSTDYLFQNTLSDIARGLPPTGRNTRSVSMRPETQFTCFSQLAREVDGGKLAVQAVCGSRAASGAGQEYIPDDELFDPSKVDPRIQALIVGGLSGAGVYVGNQLVGIVSHSQRNNFKEEFLARHEGTYERCLQAQKVGHEEIEKLKEQYKTLEGVRRLAVEQLEAVKKEEEERQKKLENIRKLDEKLTKLEEEINEFQTGTDCIDAQVAKYDTQFSIVNMLLNIHQRITRADIAEFIARQ